MSSQVLPSSFRDPSGFVFSKDGVIYRQVNQVYRPHYDRLMGSGLYDQLVDRELLVPHEEVPPGSHGLSGEAYKIIRPQPIRFISYPYEWSFSQLKAAALTTLEIQKRALDLGFTLKDASAFNIQFRGRTPVLIDTLSFEIYEEDRPWVAYRQFCEHFLAPLALMAYTDVRLLELSKSFIDGVPLDLAGRLLPARAHLNLGVLMHIRLHALGQRRYADKTTTAKEPRVRKAGLARLVAHLESTIQKLKWRPKGTEWADYVTDTNYSEEADRGKKEIVRDFVRAAAPQSVWDFGANTGDYSRIARDLGADVVAFDVDPAAVEKNYLSGEKNGEAQLLPLLVDLRNPTPDLGWNNRERDSLLRRGPAETILALALIHHLAISNNTPLRSIAGFFRPLCEHLIVEFVPKEDSQVRRLLATRRDIFPEYHEEGFERAFSESFLIVDRKRVPDSRRTIYLMRGRNSD